MTAERSQEADLEHLLSDALRPVEPPERLVDRVESTLTSVAEQAAAELESWAGELGEDELDALKDPRNWARPVAAVAVGSAAAGALLLVGVRRRQRPTGFRRVTDDVIRRVR